jgi:hypothetical protein
VIVVTCLIVGLGLRIATGARLGTLPSAKLRGETTLMVLLVAQAVVPTLQLSGSGARIAFYLWMATFPVLVGVAWVNRRAAGMAVLGAGLLLNFVVIAANGGMPVFTAAIELVSSAAARSGAIPTGDFVHVVGTAATRLPWLADVIPLSGPAWVRMVASPGDLLLYVGIVAFLAIEAPVQVSTKPVRE